MLSNKTNVLWTIISGILSFDCSEVVASTTSRKWITSTDHRRFKVVVVPRCGVDFVLLLWYTSDFSNVCCIVTDYSYVNVYELVNLWPDERTDGRTSVMRSTNWFVFLVIFHVLLLLLFVFVLSVVIVLVFVALVVVVLTKHMFVNYRLRHRKERFCFVHEVLLGGF